MKIFGKQILINFCYVLPLWLSKFYIACSRFITFHNLSKLAVSNLKTTTIASII